VKIFKFVNVICATTKTLIIISAFVVFMRCFCCGLQEKSHAANRRCVNSFVMIAEARRLDMTLTKIATKSCPSPTAALKPGSARKKKHPCHT